MDFKFYYEVILEFPKEYQWEKQGSLFLYTRRPGVFIQKKKYKIDRHPKISLFLCMF